MSPWILWFGAGWTVLLAVVFTITYLVGRRGSLARISKAMGLPVTDDVQHTINLAQRGSSNAIAISTFAGVVVAFGILDLARTTDFAIVFWAYFLVIMVALGLGTSISVLLRETARQATTVRVARIRAVELSDYVSPFRQWAPRTVVALLVIGVVVRTALTPNPAVDIPLFVWIYLAATIAVLVVAELAERRIISRGQPAGSPLELAWDDALKARAIYTLGAVPLALGSYGGLLGNISELGGFRHSHQFTAALGIGLLIGLAGMLFNLVFLIIDAASTPQQRYLRRLWPELAAQSRANDSERYRLEVEANAAGNLRGKVAKTADKP